MKIGCGYVDSLNPVTIIHSLMFCHKVKTSISYEETVHWQFFFRTSVADLKIGVILFFQTGKAIMER
jgi:hypothetical protein